MFTDQLKILEIGNIPRRQESSWGTSESTRIWCQRPRTRRARKTGHEPPESRQRGQSARCTWPGWRRWRPCTGRRSGRAWRACGGWTRWPTRACRPWARRRVRRSTACACGLWRRRSTWWRRAVAAVLRARASFFFSRDEEQNEEIPNSGTEMRSPLLIKLWHKKTRRV